MHSQPNLSSGQARTSCKCGRGALQRPASAMHAGPRRCSLTSSRGVTVPAALAATAVARLQRSTQLFVRCWDLYGAC